MGSQNVNYKQGGDTGERSSASIQPYADGEAANAAVFDRSPENLRLRSEVIRAELEDSKYLHDADRALIVSGGGTVTWNGTVGYGGDGTFSITDTLKLRAFMSPLASTPSKVTYGVLTTDQVVFSTYTTYNGVVQPPRAVTGANKLRVTVVDTSGATTAAVAYGADSNYLRVTLDSTAVTCTALVNFINASSVAKGLGIRCDLAAGTTGSTLVHTGGMTETQMAGALDAEQHWITPSGLAAFFAAGNALTDGDTLCVWYDTVTLRRSSQIDGTSPNPYVDSSLFLLSKNPERAPYALPVCSVSPNAVGDGLLLFPNQIAVDTNQALTLAHAYVSRGGDSMSGPLFIQGTADDPALTAIAGGAGAGVQARGSIAGSAGGQFIGTGSSPGATFTGGPTNGVGLTSTGQGNANGINAFGSGTGSGLVGTGVITSGSYGVIGRALGVNAGIYGSNSAGSGPGGQFVGGSAAGAGLTAFGGAGGIGVVARGGSAAVGGQFTGGANAVGLSATGGTGNASGGTFTGTGAGSAVTGTGGTTGNGATFSAGATGNGWGVKGTGVQAGSGVYGQGGVSSGNGGEFYGGVDGPGVIGQGNGGGSGGEFTGGVGNSPGVVGFGGGGNSTGVEGVGTGTNYGGDFTGGTTGAAVSLRANGGVHIKPSLTPTGAPAGTLTDGAMWYDSTNHIWRTYSSVRTEFSHTVHDLGATANAHYTVVTGTVEASTFAKYWVTGGMGYLVISAIQADNTNPGGWVTLWTLPAGFRPVIGTGNYITLASLPLVAGAAAIVRIGNDGTIQAQCTPSTLVLLDLCGTVLTWKLF